MDNRNDTGGAPTIVGVYGVDGFGIATSGSNPGSLAAHDEINEALAATDTGGMLGLLPGSYTEGVVISDDVSVVAAGGTVNLAGNSPALTVTGGSVSVAGLSLTTATNDPTVLVSGGSLTVRESFIEESTGANQFAFQVTGGTLDLGTTGDAGSNAITLSGPGGYIDNSPGGGGAAAFPWETLAGDAVLLGTTDGSRSADDVVGNPFDLTEVYATQTGSTPDQAIIRFTLTRNGSGDITGATRDYVDTSTLVHNNVGLKALDIYDGDTLFYTLEEGGGDNDGLVGRATDLAASPLTHTEATDLTGIRVGGGSDFDPEGIAIDRANNFLYVMTDDGPNQDVSQYSINPGTLALTLNWSTTIQAGATNGNDGIVLSDGRVAAVAGSGSVNIYAVSQDGTTVTNLLGGAISGPGRDTPQDLLELGGFLYVAWESGIIDAFDLSAPSTTPTASIDLDSIISGLSVGGIGITPDGHLLISTRGAGGSTGEVYALNSTAGGAAATVSASGNWWGTTDESLVDAGMNGPVDFTPFLDSGADTDGSTAGFQGDFSVLNVTALGDQTGPDGRVTEAVAAVDTAGTVNVLAGVFLHDDNLLLDRAVTINGAGSDLTEIRSAGAPSNNFDEAISITADDVTIANVQLGWGDSVSTDYQGYVVVTEADNTTINNVLFAEGYRSAVVFEGANGLEVSDSVFEGLWGRGAIRDGNSGSGENFLITRNEFREDHFRWGPIAIGPQGTFGAPNDEPFSGEISFNYFGNGLQAGAFQELGDQNFTVTVTNEGMTADGLDIFHNTFDWQDRDTQNAQGNFAEPGGVFYDPNLALAGPLDIDDNIFSGFEFGGSGTPAPPSWQPAGGVFGGALEFDGSDDFATFIDPVFDVGEQGTLNFWVNLDDVGKRNQFFEGPGDGGFEAQFRSNSGGQFFGRVNSVDANDFTIQDGGAGSLANTWANLQYTWDFASKELRIYLDGAEVGYLGGFDQNIADWDTIVETANRLFYVGRDPGDDDRYLDGMLDDIGWFDAVLNSTDRDAIRTGGVATLAADARLVAHWDLDTAAGFTEADNKNGILLTVHTETPLDDGPQFRPSDGVFGGALAFDGVDDFATFQDASFDVGTRGSLNLWINLNDTTDRNTLFEGSEGAGMEFAYRDSGTGQFFGSPERAVSSNNFAIQSGGAGPLANQWTNLQYTWDFDGGTNPEMHIYVDGTEVTYLNTTFDSSLSQWAAVVDTTVELFQVGRDASAIDRYFGGLMDDIAWYDDVLSGAELDTVRLSGAGPHADLVAHWNLDDPIGTTSVPGDSGTSITLQLNVATPPPPAQGFGVVAPAAASVLNNAFFENDLDANQVLDPSNKFGDPQFARVGTTLEEFYTIGFGSSAAYMSSEFALDHLTLTPHIGAFQDDPGLFGSGDILIVGADQDDLLVLDATGPDSADFTLTRDVGGVGQTVLGPVILTNVTSLRFEGYDGDDIFQINNPLPGDFFAPSGGIVFNGGTQTLDVPGNPPGDFFEINGPSGIDADTVTHRFDAASMPADGNDGQIEIEIVSLGLTGGNELLITYTGLEPIDDNIDADDRVFSFTAGAETITLSSPGGFGQQNSIASNLSEIVHFNNPNDSLTINTELLGGSGLDTIDLDSLDATFDADFNINGGVDDIINVNGTIEIGSGNFDLEGDDVNLAGGSLETTGDIVLTAAGVITSSGIAGEVSGDDLTATAVDGITLDTAVATITASVSGTVAGSNNIDIDETDAVVLSDVSTARGFIQVDAGGTLTATNVEAATGGFDGVEGVLGDGDVVLSTSSGDVLVSLVRAASDDLTITSAGAIEEAGPDGTTDLFAEDMTLVAVDGIGDLNPIGIDAFAGAGDGLIASVSGTGGIRLVDQDSSLRILSATTTDGSIQISATGSPGNINLETVVVGGAGNNARISAAGAIFDGNGAAVNVTGDELALLATVGIGSGNAIETSVGTLAAFNGTVSGNIEIDNASSLLTIGTVGTLVGVTNDDASNTGDVIISNTSPIHVADDVTADGDIILTAVDSAPTGFDNLTVAATDTATTGTVEITSNYHSVILNAGDDVTIPATATVQSGALGALGATNILIDVDNASAGGDADVSVTTGGSTVTLDGATTLVVPSGSSVTITGGSDNDFFDLAPQNLAPITLLGGSPVFGDPGVPPGDTLFLDTTDVTLPPTLTLGAGPGEGTYSFEPADGEMPLAYFNIETVETGGIPYHLVLDMIVSGFADGSPDDILMQLDPATSTELQLIVNDPVPGLFFSGDIDKILSFRLLGSGDNESLTISDANGLPILAGVLPAPFDFDNPNTVDPGADVPSILFAGAGGADALNYDLVLGTTDQTYALGDGFGDGFGADVGTSQGEILTVNPANTQAVGPAASPQILYFTGLEPITVTDTPGGILSIIGDSENQLVEVVNADDPTVGGPAGFTRIQAWNENRDVEPWRFAPYEFLDFAASSFTSLNIETLGGDDIVDFISLDEAEGTLELVTIFGDAGDDRLSVDTNTNGVVTPMILLSGDDGDDQFSIGQFSDQRQTGGAAHSLDGIDGGPGGSPVQVDGGDGLDRLLVDDDPGSGSPHTYLFGFAAIERDAVIVADYSLIEEARLLSGDEDDTFEIDAILPVPGLTIIEDAGGDADLIDFSPFATGVVWDMDSNAIQSLSGDATTGPRLQFVGRPENFVGSDGEDLVFVDPLVGVTRDLLGGDPDPGDTLIWDPMGAAATDAGGVISVSGFAPITHAEFDEVLALGALPVLVLDNTDAGFLATPGFAPISSQVSPFGTDVLGTAPSVDIDNNAGSGVDVGDGTVDEATWTFTDIPNGWYAVAATWVRASTGQATNATYVVHDGTTSSDPIIGGSTVNQNQDPGDFNDGGAEWRPIDYVRVTTNSLTVSLSDATVTDRAGSRDTLLADAVRLELLPASFLVDDGDPHFSPMLDAAVFTPSAGGIDHVQTAEGRFSDYHEIPAASGGTARWLSQSGLPAGTYVVSTTWGRPNTFDSAAPYSINGGSIISVNQDHSPGSFSLAGVPWEVLGVVTLDGTAGIGGDTIEVTLANGSATRPVSADGILIQPIGDVLVSVDGTPLVDGATFDFGDTGLGEVVYRTFEITNTGLAPLLLSDLVVEGTLINNFAIAGGFEQTQTLSDTTVPPGGTATFEVRFGPDLLSTNPGNPNFPTDPFNYGPYQGRLSFQSSANDSTFELGLSGSVGDKAFILDNANPNVGSVYQDPNGGTFDRGGFTRFSGQQGYQNDVAFSAAGAPNTATWSFSPIGLPDGEYQIAASWSPHPNRATNATYTVTTSSGSPSFSVNQRLAPSDFVADGGMWEVLGTVTVSGGTGTLDVTLTSVGANGFVIADAIRVQRTTERIVDQIDEFQAIDNGEEGFTCTAGCVPFNYSGNHSVLNNEVVFFPANSGESAEWDFQVNPGTYVIGVSWEPHPNRATDAAYSIGSPNRSPVGVTINQTVSANSNQGGGGAGTVIIDNETFQILDAAFVVPALSKQITVSLSSVNASGGFLIADAAFVMRVADAPFPLMASPLAEGDGTPIDQQQLDVAVEQAVDAWLGTGLNDRQLRALEDLDVRLTPILGDVLGYGSPSTGRIFIDNDGAGAGYGRGGIDLTSVVAHEIGHILGYADRDHDTDHVMGSVLQVDQQRLPLSLDTALPTTFLADRSRNALLSSFDSELLIQLAPEREADRERATLEPKEASVELLETRHDEALRLADQVLTAAEVDRLARLFEDADTDNSDDADQLFASDLDWLF